MFVFRCVCFKVLMPLVFICLICIQGCFDSIDNMIMPDGVKITIPYENMVLIPAGDFYRGHTSYKKIEIESGWDEWGTYRTTVTEKVIPEQWELTYTDAFYIDSAEVTRRDYRKFCEATGRVMPPPLTRDEWDRPIPKEFQDGYPITRITWQDAKDYAEWIGKRLPTSAEWEKAARGGLVKKPYIWGDICIAPNSWIAAGNFRLGGRTSSANAWSYLGVGLKPTKKPNEFKFRQNEYGITDMSGNATEFVSDGYDDNGHFTMGASFVTQYGYFGTAKGNRFYDGIIIGQKQYYQDQNISTARGFRCVKDIE